MTVNLLYWHSLQNVECESCTDVTSKLNARYGVGGGKTLLEYGSNIDERGLLSVNKVNSMPNK